MGTGRMGIIYMNLKQLAATLPLSEYSDITPDDKGNSFNYYTVGLMKRGGISPIKIAGFNQDRRKDALQFARDISEEIDENLSTYVSAVINRLAEFNKGKVSYTRLKELQEEFKKL